MREIKFRAWHKKRKKFYPVIHLHCSSQNELWSTVEGFALIEQKHVHIQIQPNDCIIMQYVGLKDKNGMDVYEGDIVRAYSIATEYQTHYGDNIPNGAYTEPCGVMASVICREVVFSDGCFTTSPLRFNEGEGCLLTPYNQSYDREMLNDIFFPSFYRRQSVPDDEFLEIAIEIAKEIRIEAASIDEFISAINGFEVIGNVYQNSELLNPPTYESTND